jgi:vancomycin resistance protein VanW
MQWWGSYIRHNKISRHITCMDTGHIQQQFITENNAIIMYNPLIENKK